MAISSDKNRVIYQGDGSSTIFPFQYEFHNQADLGVMIYNSSRPEIIQNKFLNTDYSVSGQADAQGRYISGANVVFNSTPATGDEISIFGSAAVLSTFTLGFNNAIPSAELVKALDRLLLLERRLNDLATRSIHLHDGFPYTFDPRIPSNLKQFPYGVLQVNSGATGFQMSGTSLVFVNINSGAIDAAQITTGILPVPRGGTDRGSFVAGTILVASSASKIGESLFGGLPKQIASVSANYEANHLDDVIRCDGSGVAFSVILPISNLALGHEFTIRKIDSNSSIISVFGSSGISIGLSSSKILAEINDAITASWNGSAYDIKSFVSNKIYINSSAPSLLINSLGVANQYLVFNSIDLVPGVYDIDAAFQMNHIGTLTGAVKFSHAISTIAGSSAVGLNSGGNVFDDKITISSSDQGLAHFPSPYRLIVATPLTVYHKTNMQYVASTVLVARKMQARRVSF